MKKKYIIASALILLGLSVLSQNKAFLADDKTIEISEQRAIVLEKLQNNDMSGVKSQYAHK